LSASRSSRRRIAEASRLQESSDGTEDGEHANTSLGSSAGELGGGGLGAGGSSSSGGSGVGGGSSVLGWVRNNRGRHARLSGSGCGHAGDDRGVGGRLDSGGGGLDNGGGGVLALLVDDGGGLGDDVGLGSDSEAGGLGADSGQASNNRGGGCVSGRGGSRRVSVVGGGGLVGRRVAVSVSVGRDGKAGDDGERAHVDCLGGWWGWY
jgi:hypothetical protein